MLFSIPHFLGCRFYLVLQTFDNYGWSRLFHPSGFGFSIRFSRYNLAVYTAYEQAMLFNGDGGNRTLDPLLARQVLSQLSSTPIPWLYIYATTASNVFRQPPALPCRPQHSTIGRTGLNRRVRDGYGCDPCAHRHRKSANASFRLPVRLPCPSGSPLASKQ